METISSSGSVVYSRHTASEIITREFSAGAKASNWRRVPVANYRSGPIAIYGFARGLYEALQKCQKGGHDWFFIDHGYLGAGHFDGYYSVTKNAFQYSGMEHYDSERLDKIRPELKPMRHGEHILLLPPSRAYAKFIELDVDEWIERYSKLDTDREIRVRDKYNKKTGIGDKTPFEDELVDCHAVVTYNSKGAITAAIEGISVFDTQDCCITGIAGDLSDIDSPDLNIDRESWLRALCNHQFTLEEMKKWDLVTTC